MSLEHYLYVIQNTSVAYRTSDKTVVTVIIGLRLGYRYHWKILGRKGQLCKRFAMRDAYTFEPCMSELERIEPYSNSEIRNVNEQVSRMKNNIMVKLVGWVRF